MRFQSSLKGSLSVAIGFLSVAAIPRSAEARVTRFVVKEQVPFAVGVDWGTAGPYERLKGTAYMEVDPRDPLNAVIVNLSAGGIHLQSTDGGPRRNKQRPPARRLYLG